MNNECQHCKWWNDRRRDLGMVVEIDPVKEGDPRRILGRCQKAREFFDRFENDWCGEFEDRSIGS